MVGVKDGPFDPGTGSGPAAIVVAGRIETECERWSLVRDTSKCKTMTAGEYMTPEQVTALQASWDECEYVLRDAVNAPEWAQFVDREGTAYSAEYLAEEQLQGDARETLALLIELSPMVASHVILDSIMDRVTAGELRAVVDSPDDWM